MAPSGHFRHYCRCKVLSVVMKMQSHRKMLLCPNFQQENKTSVNTKGPSLYNVGCMRVNSYQFLKTSHLVD